MKPLVEQAGILLETGRVDRIIGYESVAGQSKTRPVVITDPSQAGRLVFNPFCQNNLAVYLTKSEFKGKGISGIVAKGCDIRAVVQLIAEKQVAREQVYIIGIQCNGVAKRNSPDFTRDTLAEKCFKCHVRTPHVSDMICPPEPAYDFPAVQGDVLEKRLADLLAMTVEERWRFWIAEFDKCIRCYACRQVCPLCYCERCLADKSVPQWIETSSTRRANFAWHVMRAFHLAGRCSGCQECEQVCPVGIPLNLLNAYLARIAESEFSYVAGMDPEKPTLLGSFDLSDRNDFIK